VREKNLAWKLDRVTDNRHKEEWHAELGSKELCKNR